MHRQSSPILASPRDLVNWNLLDYPGYAPYTVLCHESGDVTIGGIDTAIPGDITSEVLATSFFAFILSYAAGKNVGYQGDPFSSVYIPVYDSYDNERKTVGVLVSVMRWATFFEDILPPNSEAVTIVLENTIEGAFTYLVTPTEAIFQGKGDLHDTKYDHLVRKANFDNLKMETGTIAFKLNQSLNQYTMKVYPTASFEEAHVTFLPVLVTIAVGMMFVFTAIMVCGSKFCCWYICIALSTNACTFFLSFRTSSCFMIALLNAVKSLSCRRPSGPTQL